MKEQMTTSKKVRRVLAPLAVGTGVFPVATGGNFDLAQLLAWLGSTVGAGVVVYGAIELAEKYAQKALPSNIKFYSALVLSYLVPVGAYLATVWLGWIPWNVALLIGAVVTGYQTAETVHFETVPPPTPEAPGSRA